MNANRLNFNIIQPEVIYFLGVLWADGYITYKPENSHYQIRIDCVAEDGREYINIFNKFNTWAYHERQRKHWKLQSSISTNNKEICEYLIKNDYLDKSKKTPTKILSQIPQNLHNYFWLGFFDGDGSIYTQSKRKLLSFTGTYQQDWTDIKQLFSLLNITKYGEYKQSYLNNKTNKINQCSRIKIQSNNEASKFFNYIYRNELKGLTRKYKKWAN